MNNELAKQLKEAGFSQTGDGKWLHDDSDIYQASYKIGALYIPTLSELVEACGDSFKKLWRHSNGTWSAHAGTKAGKDSFQVEGKSPEKAVAKLWLALNKND